MKLILLIAGVIALLNGLLWALQGAGVIMWPKESFMLAQPQWIWYGAATALLGIVLIAISRR